MKNRVIGAVLALAVAASVAIAPTAAAAESTSKLTVYVEVTEFVDFDEGGSESSPAPGHVGTRAGNLRKSATGAVIGDFHSFSEVVYGSNEASRATLFQTQWFHFAKGSIMTSTVLFLPTSGPATHKRTSVVVGGTGVYAGVRGTMVFQPLKNDGVSRITAARATFTLMK